MERFRAINLFSLASMIERLKSGQDILASRPPGRAKINREQAEPILVSAAIISEEIGLPVTWKKISSTYQSMKENPPISDEDLAAAFDEIFNRFHDEAESKLFMLIPSERATFYNKPELFGPDVSRRFANLQFDIVEAGNCYATGRSTACVFHLMRIMETGVQQLGIKLGVALANQKNWQNILDEINKTLKMLPAKDPITIAMSQAAANLYAVKLAWRNEVMHPKDTYTMEEAENLIGQVKIFMTQLACIL